MDEKTTKLVEALRALRNAAEEAGDDRIAKRATLDLARLKKTATGSAT
jgi:hypothetical protein